MGDTNELFSIQFSTDRPQKSTWAHSSLHKPGMILHYDYLLEMAELCDKAPK